VVQLADRIVSDSRKPKSQDFWLFIFFGERSFQEGIIGVLKSDADVPDLGVKRGRVCNSLLQWNHLEAD